QPHRAGDAAGRTGDLGGDFPGVVVLVGLPPALAAVDDQVAGHHGAGQGGQGFAAYAVAQLVVDAVVGGFVLHQLRARASERVQSFREVIDIDQCLVDCGCRPPGSAAVLDAACHGAEVTFGNRE